MTVDHLARIAAELPPDDLGSVERIAFGQRRANAAVSLLRLGQPEKVLPVFEWTDDPEALTQFVFRCRERNVGVDTAAGMSRTLSVPLPLDRYPADSPLRPFVGVGRISARRDRRNAARKTAISNRGLVRQRSQFGCPWGGRLVAACIGARTETARKIEQTEVPYSPDREWFTLAITVTPTSPPVPENSAEDKDPKQDGDKNDDASPPDDGSAANEENPPAEDPSDSESESGVEPQELPKKTFYYTFIVFPAGEYWIGSVEDEPERREELRCGIR